MEQRTSNRKRLLIGAIAAIAIVVAALALLLPPHANSSQAQAATEAHAASVASASRATTASQSDAASAEPQAESDDEASDEPSAQGAMATTLVDGREAESGVVLVELADGATAAQLNERLQAIGSVNAPAIDAGEAAQDLIELHLADGVSVEEALALLAEEDDIVASSQPNYVYHALDTQTNSSLRAETAALKATDAGANDPLIDNQWGLTAIRAFDAWETVKTNKAVTIAFIDSGIDADHADLKANIVDKASYWSSNADASDWYGHGTHTAGIAAAVTNNATGIAGASYNASIMALQALDDNGDATTQSVVWALDYAVQNAKAHNVRVVNFSIGGRSNGTDAAIDAALARAHKAGLLVVCAACNKGTDRWFYPVDFDPEAIGVMSVEQSGSSYKRSSFSNYNDEVLKTKELTAPGSSIYSTTSDGSYGYDNGTSMATPYVSATAALMFAANPALTAAQVKSLLCENTRDLGAKGWDVYYGYGLVDAAASVAAAKAAKPAATSAKSIASAQLTLSRTSYTYNGKAKKPSVTVKLGKKTLVKGTDYRVAYSNNKKAGTASVLVIGTGKYTGTATATFTIKRAKLSTLKLKKTAYVYNGKAKKPGVTVTDKKGNTLRKNVDYKVTYKKNVNAGTAKVVVTGKGNYRGTLKASFTIKRAKLKKIVLSSKALTYTGKALSPKVTVKGVKKGVANRTLRKGSDYKLTVPKGRTNAGTYTYKARGVGNYRGTVTVTLTIKRAPLTSMKLSKAIYTFNGDRCSPQVTVKGVKRGKAAQALTRGTDFRLSVPTGRIEPGTYTYTATGKGNYRGTVSAKLTIDKLADTLNGIDISSWQSDLNVAKINADFVIVKATGGTGYTNPYFKAQAEATKSSGKLLGLYHYAREYGCEGSAKAEADYFVDTVKDYVGKAVLVLDFEGEALDLGAGWAKIFLDRVYARTGVRPLIYTSKYYVRALDFTKVAKNYRLWVAQYPNYEETGYQKYPWTDEYGYGAWNAPTIFQYTGTGKLKGYASYLDLDKFYGNAAYWRKLCRKS